MPETLKYVAIVMGAFVVLAVLVILFALIKGRMTRRTSTREHISLRQRPRDNDDISLRDFLRRGDDPPPSYPLSQREPPPPPYSLSSSNDPYPGYPISHRDPREPPNSLRPPHAFAPRDSISTRDSSLSRIADSFPRIPPPIHSFDPRRYDGDTPGDDTPPPPIPARNPRRNEARLNQATTNGRPSRAALHYIPAAYRT
ncbi:hypothetical protein K449DRAFT_456605 [Hypoxylon sp. EC38]|nr:hypothetical protein K449DRAFT_456605 [Hypoxylon sp. EC38]